MNPRQWFSDLNSNELGTCSIQTINAHHKLIDKSITEEHEKLPVYEQELSSLKMNLQAIENKSLRACTKRELHDRMHLKERITILTNKIKWIRTNALENHYIQYTLPFILNSEYETNDKKAFDPIDLEQTLVKRNMDKRLRYGNRTQTLDDFITSQKTDTRADDLDDYLSHVYDTYPSSKVKFKEKQNHLICDSCSGDIIEDRAKGTRSCQVCGKMSICFIESERPSYLDQPQDQSYFCYKRINHFNENLNLVQARESTNIPEEVMNIIMGELRKIKITNMKTLSVKKMKKILKKLKFNKYCEHAPHIVAKLNGVKPPRISSEVEDDLRHMFLKIQEPFARVCPKNRKNFLSYSYVLYKMLELKNLDEFLMYFPLLKSREKLYQQDIIWKGICEILRWEFIPSV